MNILGCLDRPSEGSYHFQGQDVATLDSDALAWLRREAFGFVFQGYHLIASESASENVEMPAIDRKSTRLNSSHLVISYAVFCLKKKNHIQMHASSSKPHPRSPYHRDEEHEDRSGIESLAVHAASFGVRSYGATEQTSS